MAKSILEKDIVIGGASRKEWPNQFQFLCANISFAVGLGNIWRFPYLAQVNGGGTFLIPYFICLFFIGFPILTLELSLGQRLRQGASGVYNAFHRGFAGVGAAMVVVSIFVGVYYNMIVGWALYYFLQSFQDPLPWKACPVSTQNVACDSSIPNAQQSCSVAVESNLTRMVTQQWSNIAWPAQECTLAGTQVFYWYRETLNVTADVLPFDGIDRDMILVLVVAWCIVFMISMNGAEAGGAALYFIALMPYVVLSIFLVIGLVNDGGIEGLQELFTADWDRLSDARLWVDAASQIFFSLSVCFGGIVAFSSYNPVSQNIMRDSVIVASVNSGTSIFASCVIFSLLGNRAWGIYDSCKTSSLDNALNYFNYPEDHYTSQGKDYDDVYQEVDGDASLDANVIFGNKYCDFNRIITEDTPSGTGLIFIAVANAIIDIPGAFILSMIFFFMVILLGLGSMVGTFEGVITPLYDSLQGGRFAKIPKPALVGGMSILLFAGGTIFTTNAGNYWLDIFNDYAASINLLVIGGFQYIVVAWLFGGRKWMNEIDWMIKMPTTGCLGVVYKLLRYYLVACWMVLSPLLIFGVLIYFLIDIAQNPPSYKRWDASIGNWQEDEDGNELRFQYDAVGMSVIAILHVICLMWIPIFLIKSLWKDGRFSFSNWRYDEAILFRDGKDQLDEENLANEND